MLHKLIVEYKIILLHVASIVAMAKAFLNENFELDMELDLTTIGGFLVLLSLVVLNLAKAYKEIKSTKKDKELE